jgi:biotin transport system substrate-specific component
MRSRPSTARDLASIAAFAALIAVLGLPGTLHLFNNAVPITLQTLGVMLAGSVLGWRRGALAAVTFLALVALGLPLLAGGRGGLGVFAGASAGYLLAWPLGAAVIGWLTERRLPGYAAWYGVLANVVGGMGVIYLLGVPVQAAVTGTSLATAAAGSLLFLPGDLAKAVIAAVVAAGVHRGYPDAASSSRREQVGTVTR